MHIEHDGTPGKGTPDNFTDQITIDRETTLIVVSFVGAGSVTVTIVGDQSGFNSGPLTPGLGRSVAVEIDPSLDTTMTITTSIANPPGVAPTPRLFIVGAFERNEPPAPFSASAANASYIPIPFQGPGIAVATAAGDNAFGAWVELISAAAATADAWCVQVGIAVPAAAGLTYVQLELGAGAAGVEVPIMAGPAFEVAVTPCNEQFALPWPVLLPVGTRIAVRSCKANGAGAVTPRARIHLIRTDDVS